MPDTKIIVILLLLALLVAGCDNASSPTTDSGDSPSIIPTSADNTANVTVKADGIVLLNGVEVSIDDLKQEFERLSAINGEVCYYREDPTGEPHPIVEDVINAVMEAELSITLSTTECNY